jgi:hypothetical protein
MASSFSLLYLSLIDSSKLLPNVSDMKKKRPQGMLAIGVTYAPNRSLTIFTFNVPSPAELP